MNKHEVYAENQHFPKSKFKFLRRS